MLLPKIQQIQRSSSILNSFGGINRQESASVNEFEDALNMSSSEFPCIAVRAKRKKINVALDNFTGLINNNGLYALAMDGYDSCVLYEYDDSSGALSERARLSDSFMAGYWECNKDTQSLFLTHNGLCTLDLSDPDNIKGRRIAQEYKIEPKYTGSSTTSDTIDPNDPGQYCRMSFRFDDGTLIENQCAYKSYEALREAFENNASSLKEGGVNIIWCDIAGSNYKLAYRIDQTGSAIVAVDKVTARFSMPENAALELLPGDYIKISNARFVNGGVPITEVEEIMNKYYSVVSFGTEEYITGKGTANEIPIREKYFDVEMSLSCGVHISIGGNGGKGRFMNETVTKKNSVFLITRLNPNDEQATISLDVPGLDCICEAQNRIWGASNKEHSIYCCALGEVNNWYRYEGISSDSWAATVGSEGEFTGCASLNGAPVFFKENEMIVVTGSRPASYSITSYDCPGVVKGAGTKTCVHRGSLFYISRDGVYSYTGSGPVCISPSLCDEISNWSGASIFCHRNRLYVMLDKAAYVYDLDKNIWHKESGLVPKSIAATNEGLVYLCLNTDDDGNYTNDVIVYDDTGMNRIAQEYEEDLYWYIETKTLGNDVPAKKYLAQIDIALELRGSCSILVKYDSGEWIRIREFNDNARKTEKLCFYPRRSDHFKLRLEGVGYAKIHSITETLEESYENG